MTAEGFVLNACLEYLQAVGIFAWRNNTGAMKIHTPSGDRFLRYGLTGSSDILGILNDGRFLAIECKADAGRLSKSQEDFLATIRSRGGVAIVARCIEDVELGLSEVKEAVRG